MPALWMKPRGRTVRGPAAWLLVGLALAIVFGGGCVRRRMMIRSNPEGARVYVDGYDVGTTPTAHDFTYYGTRQIRLVKDGYQTKTVMESIPAPWYQIPPLDFISENLIPGKITDRRNLVYQMVPEREVMPDEILGRADSLRASVQTTVVPTSAPPLAPPAGYGGQPVQPIGPSGW
ncbi:MAG: PEGA domain-containing protein [Pirellulales bacterium]|nr:PEGA domain-containing protein [Pirellulales bacterium]